MMKLWLFICLSTFIQRYDSWVSFYIIYFTCINKYFNNTILIIILAVNLRNLPPHPPLPFHTNNNLSKLDAHSFIRAACVTLIQASVPSRPSLNLVNLARSCQSEFSTTALTRSLTQQLKARSYLLTEPRNTCWTRPCVTLPRLVILKSVSGPLASEDASLQTLPWTQQTQQWESHGGPDLSWGLARSERWGSCPSRDEGQ